MADTWGNKITIKVETEIQKKINKTNKNANPDRKSFLFLKRYFPKKQVSQLFAPPL